MYSDEERRKKGDLLETHKIMHGLQRIPEIAFFARGDTLRRGHTLKIYKERSKLEPCKQEFLFTTCIVIPWNALGPYLKRQFAANLRCSLKSNTTNFGGFK